MSIITSTQNDEIITQPKWLTLLRIILGIIILYKGFIFFKNSVLVESLLKNNSFQMIDKNSETIAFIITYINLLGGFFILIGLFTRWMCIIQIPILLGAIFFVQDMASVSFTNTELLLSIAVLVLLILFAIKGSGALSADEYFRNYTKAALEPGHTKNLFN